MTLLVLTDHATHGAGESIYELLHELAKLTSHEIHVASRSHPSNALVLTEFDADEVFVKPLDHQFAYSEDGAWFANAEPQDAQAYDAVFLRMDRPLSDHQLGAIAAKWAGKTIVNDPEGVVATGSKKFLLNFPSLCPDIRLVSSPDEVTRLTQDRSIVLKPIYGYGGIGIVRVSATQIWHDVEPQSLAEDGSDLAALFAAEPEYLAMSYLDRVGEGDKRVVVVGDRVVGATLRLPATGSWLCNLKQGGRAAFADVSEEEHHIASTISKEMIKNGVWIYGFDTLMGNDGQRVLSEINTLNVGGFVQAQKFSGEPVLATVAQELVKAFG